MTHRLVTIARENWARIDGAYPDLDLLALPIDRFLNHIYQWFTKDRTPQAIEKLDALLWMPPKGVVADRGPWSVEAETEAFGSLAAQVKAPDAGGSAVKALP